MTVEAPPERVRKATHAWMRHLGYTDQEIATAEQETHQTAGCEFEHPDWNCFDEDGKSLHPVLDALTEAAEAARVMLDADADDTQFEAFLGGYEAVYDDDVDLARVRTSYQEWVDR